MGSSTPGATSFGTWGYRNIALQANVSVGGPGVRYLFVAAHQIFSPLGELEGAFRSFRCYPISPINHNLSPPPLIYQVSPYNATYYE